MLLSHRIFGMPLPVESTRTSPAATGNAEVVTDSSRKSTIDERLDRETIDERLNRSLGNEGRSVALPAAGAAATTPTVLFAGKEETNVNAPADANTLGKRPPVNVGRPSFVVAKGTLKEDALLKHGFERNDSDGISCLAGAQRTSDRKTGRATFNAETADRDSQAFLSGVRQLSVGRRRGRGSIIATNEKLLEKESFKANAEARQSQARAASAIQHDEDIESSYKPGMHYGAVMSKDPRLQEQMLREDFFLTVILPRRVSMRTACLTFAHFISPLWVWLPLFLYFALFAFVTIVCSQPPDAVVERYCSSNSDQYRGSLLNALATLLLAFYAVSSQRLELWSPPWRR